MSLLSWTDAWWQTLLASTVRHRLIEAYWTWRVRRWWKRVKAQERP